MIISKAQADALVSKHETFYRKDLKINGVDVFIYNYLLSDLEAFNDLDGLGKELRGLTIVHEPREAIFLSMPKFFNLNENEDTQYKNIKLKKIKKITQKADGSLIMPVRINGDVVMKTKQSFDNPQAKEAQTILDNSADLKFFIMDCWDNNFYPLFELIGPDNRIVVDYPETKLILIGVRDEKGSFVDVEKFNYKYTVQSYDYTLDELIKKAKEEKGIEGWVVKLQDETIIKIKTTDYITRHRLVSSADSYKSILAMILDETFDDVLSEVNEKKRKELQEIQNLVAMYVSHWTKFCYDASRNIQDRLQVVNKYKTHEYFTIIMRSIKLQSEEQVKEAVIRHLKANYNREEKAKAFIKKLKGIR